MPTYTVTPASGPNQPTFLRAPGLIEIKIPVLPTIRGVKIDAQKIADAINRRMSLSQRYADALAEPTLIGEGATLWFLAGGKPSLDRKSQQILGGNTAAISLYPQNSGSQTFRNDAGTPNQLGVVFDDDVVSAGAVRYDLIAEILPEEIIFHPKLGRHQFDGVNLGTATPAQILADPVELAMIQISRQTGLKYVFQAAAGIPQGVFVVAQDALARVLQDNPGYWTGPGQPPPGTQLNVAPGSPAIYVVSNAQFGQIKALELSMAVNSRLGFGPSPYPPGMGPLLSPDEIAAALQSVQPPNWAVATTSLIGSTLGSYLFSQNPVEQVVGTALLQTIGLNFAQAISQGGISIDFGYTIKDNALVPVRSNVLSNFGTEFKNAVTNAAIGSFSSLISLELGNALGLKGFGAELFQTSATTVVGQVLNNAIDIANNVPGTALFSGLDTKGLFGSVKAGTPGLLPGAIGSFFGAKLGSLILAPTSTEGAILASLGSGLGVIALTSGAAAFGLGGVAASLGKIFGSFANIGVPFVGSLVGFLLGSLIGRLFGRKKPRIPSASAEISLSLDSGYWVAGAVTSANGGNVEFAKEMAGGARETINGIISTIVGGADIAPLGSATPHSQRYGHSGTTVYVDELVGSGYVRRYSGTDASVAVDIGAVSAAKSTKVRGGDLLVKRALYGSTQTTAAGLLGDLVVALDYTEYALNKLFYNTFFQENPNAALSASWYATFARADELGLTNFQPSDFFGGMGGFVQSFGYGVEAEDGTQGLAYENLSVQFEGAALRIATTDGSAPFELLSGSNNVAAADAAKSVYIADFGANVAYTPWNGQATAGNDIWIASGGGPVTMDDTATEWVGYWDPYYGYYYQYPVTVSGGDDIFVGSAYDDALYGRTGWDWLDGGAGNDLIDGGENDDVLMGRDGSDRMLGGSGNDYIAGGDGNDYFFDANQTWGLYGGDGNDVLVGGAGMDSPYGENGDDTIIVDQDGGGVWDAINGQAGSDTISYERFTSGVSVDFSVLGGWSWDPSAKYIYGDAISGVENVTGSKFNDVILGDAGANRLRGLEGDDTIDGRDGDDVIEGGRGRDSLTGGAGTDTASYEHSGEGVAINLTTNQALGGDAAGDTFASIENVRGSSFDDILTGNAGDNMLTGMRGNDSFMLTGGNDVLDGGDGIDELDASGSTSGLTVYYDSGYWSPYYSYPGAGWIAYTGSGTTTFSSIESFVGTAYDDYISGDAADEIYRGGAGNDTLYGGAGSDTYVFGRGDGQDSVSETHDSANAIALGKGIDWRDVAIAGAYFGQQGGNLVVSIRGTADQIVVGGNFSYVNSGSNAGNHNHAIKSLSLAGVSTVDLDTIDYTPYAADENSTVVYGAQNRADLIFAYGGDDTIYVAGSSSAYETRGNVVYAGDGNDTVFGSGGDDQYIFERGNGIDTLTDSGGMDTIVMGPSVNAEDVIYEVVTTNAGSDGWGATADLYIGLRDPNNPNATASQVADRIRVIDGGTKMVGAYNGGEYYNTTEYVRVGGQEIDLTKAGVNWTTSYYYDGGWYFPVALDLDGDGIELRSVQGSRIASVEADGTITRMGWLGQDDGFLALDRDGNGVIDRIGEISFVGDVVGAKTDLEGLAAYDSNKDGKLDAQDARWGEFRVWQDRNQDGFGSADELVELDAAGLASIALKGQATGFTAADGPDNTVIATADIAWHDPSRTGSAYDVALARLQVRTDTGGADLGGLDAAARGVAGDGIDAMLYGVQSLTAEQVAAIKARKAGTAADGSGGRFYRVETLLQTGAVVRDGLYAIDAGVAARHAEAARAVGGIADSFAASDWTLQGSLTTAAPDLRGADARFVPAALNQAQRGAVDAARQIVADRQDADAARTAAIAAKDAVDAVVRPAPMPSAAELARMKGLDKFRLLDGAAVSADADAVPVAPLRSDPLVSPVARDEAVAPIAPDAATAGDTAVTPDAAPRAAATGAARAPVDPADYGVTIRTANARLVQALAVFGNPAAMMASHRPADAANDADGQWLSVHSLPSIDKLVAIR